MWKPIATIPLDTFVLITDDPNNPLAPIVRGQLRSFGGFQFIGPTPFGGANFYAPVPSV